MKDIIVEDTTNNLWWLVKSKRCDTAGIFPLKRNGLTFSEIRAEADILNDQFCNVFIQEDPYDLPTFEDMLEITVNKNAVYKLLLNLNPRIGPDGVPCCLLKVVTKNLH